MTSKLEQLRAMTTVVADTGDMDAIRAFRPTDCTTNPTLILKAAQMEPYAHLVDEAVLWARKNGKPTAAAVDRVAVNFGEELSRIVPGRVSTEVDADLSFDVERTVEKARAIIADYERRGIGRERVLIKIAATWEGTVAAERLQREGIDCNLTLIFSLAQAVACAQAKAHLISPFVGRILDWHVKAQGRSFAPHEDPGVLSVRAIYAYYKAYGIDTVVMGASFRSQGEIEELAGCDRLTISPQFLESLSKDNAPLTRRLSADTASQAPAKMVLDEAAFRWMLNEDAMATEKLAEGIRAFAKDLHSLQTMMSKKLETA